MIVEAIKRAASGGNLSETEMEIAVGDIMDGRATPAQIAAFLTALRMKGETVEEITGAARAMRDRSIKIPLGDDARPSGAYCPVDTCGTGGDGANTFNVSTVSAFVVAGAGLQVAKHGNRSVSSRCGSADLMEALGVPLDLTPQQVALCIEQVGVGFLFAPRFHPAMRHAMGPRREIGIRTLFNLVGPLTNPAGARAQVIGVADPNLVPVVAHVLERLGCPSGLVVHGQGGLDELSTLGETRMARVRKGRVEFMRVTPEEVGLKRASLDDVRGADARQNASIAQEILQGTPGAPREMVLLNAAAAIWVAGAASDLREGLEMAAHSIDSGMAMSKLKGLSSLARSLAGCRENQGGHISNGAG